MSELGKSIRAAIATPGPPTFGALMSVAFSLIERGVNRATREFCDSSEAELVGDQAIVSFLKKITSPAFLAKVAAADSHAAYIVRSAYFETIDVLRRMPRAATRRAAAAGPVTEPEDVDALDAEDALLERAQREVWRGELDRLSPFERGLLKLVLIEGAEFADDELDALAVRRGVAVAEVRAEILERQARMDQRAAALRERAEWWLRRVRVREVDLARVTTSIEEVDGAAAATELVDGGELRTEAALRTAAPGARAHYQRAVSLRLDEARAAFEKAAAAVQEARVGRPDWGEIATLSGHWLPEPAESPAVAQKRLKTAANTAQVQVKRLRAKLRARIEGP